MAATERVDPQLGAFCGSSPLRSRPGSSRRSNEAPGGCWQVGAGREDLRLCALSAAHSRTQPLAATPGAQSHSLSARGSGAQWTRHCSTACWRPTAAWNWPRSWFWTAGGCPCTPRVGERRADPGGAGSLSGALSVPGSPRSSALRPASCGAPRTPVAPLMPTPLSPVTRSLLLLQHDLGPDRDVLAPERGRSPGGEAVPRVLQRSQVQHDP